VRLSALGDEMVFEMLKKVIPRKEEVEVPVVEPEKPEVTIRVANLTGLVDVERIITLVREGNILFLRMAELQKKDLGQFQATLQRLRRHCVRSGWDIVAVGEGYLIITPEYARIVR
jgi:SepF-like predicted cell division protein (DUF552 family)